MWKRIGIVFGVLFLIPLLQAQVGPTVFTPRLTVSPGPLTVSTGATTVQDLTVNGSLAAAGVTLTSPLPVTSGGTGVTTATGTGSTVRSASPTLTGTTTVADLTVSGTCTGCGSTTPGGSNTQVQFNNTGAFGGDAGLTYNSGTDTLTAGTYSGSGASLTALNASNLSSGTVPSARVSGTYSNALTLSSTSNALTLGTGSSLVGNLSLGGSGQILLDNGSALLIRDSANTTTRYTFGLTGTFNAAGGLQVNGTDVCQSTGTNCPAGSSTIGSPTCNGFSSTTSCALRWTDLGAQACVTVSVAGTSNATSFTMTSAGVPNPVYVPNNSSPLHTVDNGVSAITLVSVNSGGDTITFTYGATFSTTGFTASGSKGASGTFCYGITP